MSLPYIRRNVTISSGATDSSVLFIDDSIDTRALILCGIKLSAAITSNTCNIQMCPTSSGTFADIKDEDNALIDFTLAGANYVKLKPTDYAVFDAYIRIHLGAAASANTTATLFFRPV